MLPLYTPHHELHKGIRTTLHLPPKDQLSHLSPRKVESDQEVRDQHHEQTVDREQRHVGQGARREVGEHLKV